MPQPKKGPRLGAGPKHQKRLLSNLAVSLFEHEQIRTTEAKAKALRPYAERLITKAKAGSVHDRRQVLSVIEDRDVVHKLFSDIGPRFSERNGGYTRILKLGPRNGDGAPMALIELVEGEAVARGDGDGEAPGRRRRGIRRRRRGGQEADASTAAADESAEADEDEFDQEEDETTSAESEDEVEAEADDGSDSGNDPGDETGDDTSVEDDDKQ